MLLLLLLLLAGTVGMREPSDDEFTAFDAVAFQYGRFPRAVQDRLGQVSRRDGRRPGRRFGTATNAGATLAVAAAATAATTTTGSRDAVAFIIVIVVDELGNGRIGGCYDRRRKSCEFLRRRQKEFLEDGRTGRVPFVVDRQRLAGKAMLMFGPSASKRFVERAPRGQHFGRHVVPPDGQERSADAAYAAAIGSWAGTTCRMGRCRVVDCRRSRQSVAMGRGRRDCVVLFERP